MTSRDVSHTPAAREILMRVADRNLAVALRHLGSHAGSVVDDGAGRLLVASSCPHRGPLLNAALRTDADADPGAVVEEAQGFFGRRRRPWVLWTTTGRDDDLVTAALRHGLRKGSEVGEGPVMALERPPAPPALGPAQMRRVRDARDARAFARVVSRAFATNGQPPEVAETLFSDPAALLSGDALAILARVGGEPVSCALTMVERGGGAGIYFVGTVPEARGAGLGEAVTRAATLAGFEAGATCVVLHAARRAVPVYERVGFSALADCTFYEPAPVVGAAP